MTVRATRYSPVSSDGALEVDVDPELRISNIAEPKDSQEKASLINGVKSPLFYVHNGYLSIRYPNITFIESWDQAIIFCSYIVLNLLYGTWIHATQGIHYSPTMMIMSVLMTKLIVSIIAFMVVDGTLPQLLDIIWTHKKSLLLFIFPAFAYATTDSLGVYCLKQLDPSTFAILYNIRVVFMLVLFQYFMGIPLRKLHWISMGVITLSCIIKELPQVLFPQVAIESTEGTMIGDSSIVTASLNHIPRVFTVFILVFMAHLSAFAAVYNEKLLKEQQLSLNVQNVAMYVWAIIATSFFSILVPLFQHDGTVLQDIGNPDMWKTIWTYPVIVAVFLSATYGLVTSFFIKSLNNIVREIASGVYIIGTIPVNVFFFGYSVQFTDFLAVIGVIVGLAIYNRSPLKK